MIDYLLQDNYYSFSLQSNYTASLPRITKNFNTIEQIDFPPTNIAHYQFDDSYAGRMEKENTADVPEPGPSTCTVHVENTATETSEEPQSISVECHARTCLCCECQEKYGSLPLFAQVLDSQNQTELTFDGETLQPQSSTSTHGTSTTTTASSKKQPFQCDICKKRFSHRGDYHKHVRVHSGDRPYTCAHCPLRFAHPSNRARHLRSHSTERPYHCHVCNRKFYRKDKLDRHRMSNRCRKMTERDTKR